MSSGSPGPTPSPANWAGVPTAFPAAPAPLAAPPPRPQRVHGADGVERRDVDAHQVAAVLRLQADEVCLGFQRDRVCDEAAAGTEGAPANLEHGRIRDRATDEHGVRSSLA